MVHTGKRGGIAVPQALRTNHNGLPDALTWPDCYWEIR
jgi:hypothetical protein